MNETQRDELFSILLEMSDLQFDGKAKEQLKNMVGRPNAEIRLELVALIDDCVRYSWVGCMELKALQFVHMKMGGTESDFTEGPNAERRARIEKEESL